MLNLKDYLVVAFSLKLLIYTLVRCLITISSSCRSEDDHQRPTQRCEATGGGHDTHHFLPHGLCSLRITSKCAILVQGRTTSDPNKEIKDGGRSWKLCDYWSWTNFFSLVYPRNQRFAAQVNTLPFCNASPPSIIRLHRGVSLPSSLGALIEYLVMLLPWEKEGMRWNMHLHN